MVDAMAAVMSMEDKEFYKVGELAVAVMIETATAITGDPYKASMKTAKQKKKKKATTIRLFSLREGSLVLCFSIQ